MKQATIIAAVLMALATPAVAQQSAADHTTHHPTQTQGTAALSEGEVRRVDKDANKLTIRHGPIVNIDMPPMTMVFQVKEPAMLDKVKIGDKVKFAAEKAGGAFTITNIEVAK